MRIGIVGLGYVGLTLAIVAAVRGAEVFGTELNSKIKAALSENRAHFFEPGLDALIAKHNYKNFHCVDDLNTPPTAFRRVYNHGRNAALSEFNRTEFRGDKRGD